MEKIALIAFTENGRQQAELIRTGLSGAEIREYRKGETPLADYVREAFSWADTIVFISAMGIAVRSISPYIRSKDKDPAVIVMDELANHVIPVLSGHLGGANEGAWLISDLTGAVPVITTATDINRKFAVDIWTKKNGCKIEDISKIKEISSAVLEGKTVEILSDFPVYGQVPEGLKFIESPEQAESHSGIVLSFDGSLKPFEETLNAVPQILVLGVGCRRDTDSQVFEERILEILEEHRISIDAVSKVASIDIKKDEKCIHDFCRKYGLEVEFYSAEELNAVEGEFTPSKFVKSVTGVENVCERSAAKASFNGKIVMEKIGGRGVTLALAQKDWECRF